MTFWLLLAEDRRTAGLGCDRGVVARRAVAAAQVAPSGVRGAGTILVVAVDDRGEAGRRARRDAEVVEQVAVAGARHAALADAAVVVDRRGGQMRPRGAGCERLQVLGEPDRPRGRQRVVIRRVGAVVVG